MENEMGSNIQLRNIRQYADDEPATKVNGYGNAAFDDGPEKDIENSNSCTKEGNSYPLPPKDSVIVMDETDLQISKYTDVENWDKVVTNNSDISSVVFGENVNRFLRFLIDAEEDIDSCWNKNKHIFRYVFIGILLAGYVAYFGYAMHYEFGSEPSVRLLWVSCVVVFFLLANIFWKHCGERVKEGCRPCIDKLKPHENLISWILVAALYVAIIIFVMVDIFVKTKSPYNLVSGSGLFAYILLFFIFSKHRTKVNWRAVAWGLALQFVFAMIILRSRGGYIAFEWLGEQLTIFLSYSDAGAEFVFGENFEEHFFAFKILPTVVFFSTVISVLYYLGAMQVIIQAVAFVMQFTMKTTAGESTNAAGNIFVGMTETPLMIRPLLPHMTKSELHAVMTGGFATIAGGVMAAFIGFGIPANHLLSASVMSAPAALAMSKLLYPETEKSKTTSKDVARLPKSEEINLIAAAANGAHASIKVAAAIAVNLIAFISILDFINSTLIWFGHRVGLFDPPLTFQLICSYVLYPFAILMGIVPEDCRQVAKLIGMKTFFNEFMAYTELSTYMTNRHLFEDHIAANGTWVKDNDDVILDPLPGMNVTQTLTGGILTVRSEIISTYALCGFASISSIGMLLGVIGAMAPSRMNDLAVVSMRAMIAGTVASFMTASIAGLFFQEDF